MEGYQRGQIKSTNKAPAIAWFKREGPIISTQPNISFSELLATSKWPSGLFDEKMLIRTERGRSALIPQAGEGSVLPSPI